MNTETESISTVQLEKDSLIIKLLDKIEVLNSRLEHLETKLSTPLIS